MQEGIKAIIDAWVKSVQDRDIEGIIANHSDNIVLYDVPTPFQSVGIDAYRRAWEQSFFKGTEKGIYKILELTIEASEEVAFCFGTVQCSWANDGKFEDLKFRLTVGLKKINKRWIITHEHHSIPSE